jgi:hypothetical protein
MNRALIDFAEMSDAALDAKALTVVTAMTGNTNFPGATTLLAAVQNAKDTYSAALSVAEFGTPSQKAEKNTAKALLVTAMRFLCGYVNFTTSDRIKLLTSGFTIGPEFVIPTVLQALRKLLLYSGDNHGEVIVKVVRGVGTQSLIIEYAVGSAITATTVWNICKHKNGLCTISGLTPADTVWVRVTSLGTRNQVIVSDAQKIIVQ